MLAQNAAAAYAKTTQTTIQPRGVELKAFLRVNGLLIAANKKEKPSMAEIADAVHMNTKLWTLLATDLASDGNGLEDSLKAQLISLALYSQKTGLAVLRGEAELSALIEINSPIINGLSGRSGVEQNVAGEV